jgi:predicted metal-dependent hydrolase
VAAPLETINDTIRLFIISRMHWIKKQQLRFQKQERQTRREYVAGESHYLFGKRYRLHIIHTYDRPKVEIRNRTRINLHVRPDSTAAEREEIFDKFYRSELRNRLPSMLERWQKKLHVEASEVRIKKMKTR